MLVRLCDVTDQINNFMKRNPFYKELIIEHRWFLFSFQSSWIKKFYVWCFFFFSDRDTSTAKKNLLATFYPELQEIFDIAHIVKAMVDIGRKHETVCYIFRSCQESLHQNEHVSVFVNNKTWTKVTCREWF